jgi:hypothetical protein
MVHYGLDDLPEDEPVEPTWDSLAGHYMPGVDPLRLAEAVDAQLSVLAAATTAATHME